MPAAAGHRHRGTATHLADRASNVVLLCLVLVQKQEPLIISRIVLWAYGCERTCVPRSKIACPGSVAPTGHTALMAAAASGLVPICEALLAAKANVGDTQGACY